MTEQELQAIDDLLASLPGQGEGWWAKEARPGGLLWEVRCSGGDEGEDYLVCAKLDKSESAYVAKSASIIRQLLAEVQFLRGQLADLALDSRAVAEVGRLRVVLGEVRGLTDAANDGWRDLLSRHPGAAIRLHTMQDTIDAALEGGGE